MKLAEAVNMRKQMRTKLSTLEQLIGQHLVVSEGETPEEDVKALIIRYEELQGDYRALINAINAANNMQLLEINMSLSQLIVKRDRAKDQARAFRMFEGNARTTPARSYGVTTVARTIAVVKSSELRERAEELDSIARDADMTLQRLDWVVDVQF